MILTLNWLKERHQFWAKKLKDLGIFAIEVASIPFEIKYNVKSYNGMYRRRKGVSKIILYPPNTGQIDQQWVDNVLVHEMIHQYIHENNLHDNSSHGPIFKSLMWKINHANIGVTICVATKAESYVNKAEVKTYEIHNILVLKFSDKFFLCKVKFSSINRFNELILTHRMSWKQPLLGFGWYKTNNAHFNNFQKCVTRLHGEVQPLSKWNEIFESYQLTKFETISEL